MSLENGLQYGGEGALLGSAIAPGIGTLVGGVVGLGAGLLGFGDSTPMPDVGGPNPYQGQWDALIKQLQDKAAGRGPSMAGDAYKQASEQGMSQMSALSRSGSAGHAGQVAGQIANVNQGLAGGYSRARTAEMEGARGQLTGALQGAGQAWMDPQRLSLEAWGMQNGLNAQKLAALSQMIGKAGSLVPRDNPDDQNLNFMTPEQRAQQQARMGSGASDSPDALDPVSPFGSNR